MRRFLQIPCLHAPWLCNDVADTARRPLPLGVVRRGGTRHNQNAGGNDQLVLGVCRRNGHPFLRAIVERLIVVTGKSEGCCLAVVSECVRHTRTHPRRGLIIKANGSLMNRFKTVDGVRVKNAIHWAKDNTNVHRTYVTELRCKYEAERACVVADPGAGFCTGMRTHRFPKMSHKLFTLIFHIMRLDFPNNVELRVENGKCVRIDDHRSEEERRNGLSIPLLLRLIPDRENHYSTL